MSFKINLHLTFLMIVLYFLESLMHDFNHPCLQESFLKAQIRS